jgi:O-antigen/teichoic acid export membrane protein
MKPNKYGKGEQGSVEVPPGKKNRSRYILINTLSSYGRDIVDTVIFLIMIPFIIKMLGSESFGLWSLIWSFLAIFELADLGFAASVIKYVADARGRQDTQRLTNVVCTLFWMYVFLGIVVAGGISVSLLFFNRVFQIPVEQAPMAQAVLLILGVRTALYLPLGMFRGVLVGFQKMNLANGYKALASVLYLAGVLVFLSLFPDIRVLATVNVVTGVLPMLAMMIQSQRIIPQLRLGPAHFKLSLVKELSSFSLYFSLTQVAGMLATRADAMIIKLFLPLEAVGIYSVGMRLSEKAYLFCSHLTRTLTPVFAELYGSEERSNMQAAHYLGSKLTVAFSAPLLVGLGLLAEPLILAWTGPDFLLAVPVCQWLTAATMVSILHGNTLNVLSMGGHQRYVALSVVGGQILNLILSLLLIKPLGIVGVSMATLISAVPVYIGLIEGFAGRLNGRSIWHFYKATVLPSVIPILIMAASFVWILRHWKLNSLIDVAILEALGIALFGIIFWCIGFNSEERAYFVDKFRRAFFRRKSLTSEGP